MSIMLNGILTALLGLYTGNQLGICYVLWFRRRDEMSESQKRYVAATAGLGSVVVLWIFTEFVVNLVRVFTLTA